MKESNWFRKGLVVVIITLFIGVGIHPAFANYVSITKKVDSEDDCNCNDEFDDNDKFERPICGFLQLLIAYYLKFSDDFEERARRYYHSHPYLYNIYMRLSERMDRKAREIIDFGASIDCWDYPYP